MLPKIFHWIGLAACITLIVCCFLPWTYYADIDKTFTGFFSEQNEYGKPGVFLVALATISFIFILLPKLWAKRANLFLCALCVGYSIKTYILCTSCYNTFCPEKKAGIYIMLFSTFAMMLSAVFPDFKLEEKSK
ncbi:MAG: hypothetical protein WDM71_08340 [Ferruginibacter sp.]